MRRILGPALSHLVRERERLRQALSEATPEERAKERSEHAACHEDAGTILHSRTGKTYEVQEDGSWRRAARLSEARESAFPDPEPRPPSYREQIAAAPSMEAVTELLLHAAARLPRDSRSMRQIRRAANARIDELAAARVIRSAPASLLVLPKEARC